MLHAERGDVDAARAAYLAAIDVYSELGADWDIMRADSRLRKRNIRRGTRSTRRQPVSGWNSLIATERKIALLVAEGQSNPDISTHLFLSRST